MILAKISYWVDSSKEATFKGTRLNPMQLAIINCNQRHHVFACLPTGFGKSVLFHYPASRLTRTTILVFVPLKTMLQDSLKEAKLSNLSAAQLAPAFIDQFQKQKKLLLPQLLFLTPERLFMNNKVRSFIESLIKEEKIELVVIDDAHCMSEWAAGFRPDYARLRELPFICKGIRMLLISASLPAQARKDLFEGLNIVDCYYFQSSCNRANLHYEVRSTSLQKAGDQVMGYVASKGLLNNTGIIYCQTINKSEKVYNRLKELGFDCSLFHSELTESARDQAFQNFITGRVKAVVATVCFGMGANKKDIRYVINVGVSLSAENYYQESGRAGRDGLPAYCLLLTYPEGYSQLQLLIAKSTNNEAECKRKLFKLAQIKDYALQQKCRKQHLFELLGQQFSQQRCKETCDFCFAATDYTEIALSFLRTMAISDILLTKNQLITLLGGREISLKTTELLVKARPLKGIMENESYSTIKLIIQKLIQLGALKTHVVHNRFGEVAYLKVTSKDGLSEVKEVKVALRQKSKPIPSARKLNAYSKNQTKSEPDLHASQQISQDPLSHFSFRERTYRLKSNQLLSKASSSQIIQQTDRLKNQQQPKPSFQDELQEINLAPSSQYHSFLNLQLAQDQQLDLSHHSPQEIPEELRASISQADQFLDSVSPVQHIKQAKYQVNTNFSEQFRRQKADRSAKAEQSAEAEQSAKAKAERSANKPVVRARLPFCPYFEWSQ